MSTVKAITLHQPWASFVALGVKAVETRSWATGYRGPLAIHAAARRPDVTMLEDGPAGELFDENAGPGDDPCLAQWWESPARDFIPPAPTADRRWSLSLAPDFATHPMPLGAVVATCRLVDCVPTDGEVPGICWWEGSDPLPAWHAFGAHRNDPAGIPSDRGLYMVAETQRPYGDFAPGRFAWMLADITPLAEPVPAKGGQRLWEWTRG